MIRIIDLKNEYEAQDMISILLKKNNTTEEKVILSVINEKNFKRIVDEGWARLAVRNWFIHNNNDNMAYIDGNYAISFTELKSPKIEIDFKPKQIDFLEAIMFHEKVKIEEAISYFLIFEMESLGYHI